MPEPTKSGDSSVLHDCLRLSLVLPFSFQPHPSPCLGLPLTQRKSYGQSLNTAGLKGKDQKEMSEMICSRLASYTGFSMEHLKLYLPLIPNSAF